MAGFVFAETKRGKSSPEQCSKNYKRKIWRFIDERGDVRQPRESQWLLVSVPQIAFEQCTLQHQTVAEYLKVDAKDFVPYLSQVPGDSEVQLPAFIGSLSAAFYT